jgi:lysophospholipase L1-like esterase
MTRTTQFCAAAALGIVLGAAACHNDELFRPANFTPIDPLFERYVSMGNSITAGFQSGGILDSTQRQAYPVLLAGAMQSPFFSPLLARPGCPPPYTNVFTGTRFTPPGYPVSTDSSCYLRNIPPIPPPFISNTAVPGAYAIDPADNLDPASHPNPLTLFLLGGLTQAQMMARAHPTFVTVWIGYNDFLGAAIDTANAGDITKITRGTEFQASYTELVDALDSAGPRGVVLIGIANVVTPANRAGLPPTQPPANGVPFFSYGSTYYALDQAGAIPGPFTAAASCAPPRGDSVLVPVRFGGALINGGGTLTCNEPQTIDPVELQTFVNTVAAYNAFIAAQAASHAWAYFDPNPALDSLRKIPTQVAYFPTFGAACSANPFGLAFSCDGIHPSATSHKLIANKLRQAINTAYATAIPAIP